ATRNQSGMPRFGVRLTGTPGAASVRPGDGCRRLATLAVPATRIGFNVSWRKGLPEPDIRVELRVPGLRERWMPLKDHHLLLRSEQAPDMPGRLRLLHQALEQMGEQVAVRLGLSRPFRPRADNGPGCCWLMVD